MYFLSPAFPHIFLEGFIIGDELSSALSDRDNDNKAINGIGKRRVRVPDSSKYVSSSCPRYLTNEEVGTMIGIFFIKTNGEG